MNAPDKAPTDPLAITLTLSREAMLRLHTLTGTGLYGQSLADTALILLLERLREIKP